MEYIHVCVPASLYKANIAVSLLEQQAVNLGMMIRAHALVPLSLLP